MKGFYLAEQGKPVVGIAPIDIGGAVKTSDYWSMENYSHVSIIVACGAITNAATITVYESEDNSGTGEDAVAFSYYAVNGSGVTGSKQTATTAGFSTGTTNDRLWVIEIDAAELSADHHFMTVKTTDAAANLIAVIPILSGARYQSSTPPAALS
jgi:hypothetical protein